MNVREYERLLEEVPRLKQRKAEARGAIDQLVKSLFAEHGVSSLEEAKKLLKELQEEKNKEEAVIAKDYEIYLKLYEKMEE